MSVRSVISRAGEHGLQPVRGVGVVDHDGERLAGVHGLETAGDAPHSSKGDGDVVVVVPEGSDGFGSQRALVTLKGPANGSDTSWPRHRKRLPVGPFEAASRAVVSTGMIGIPAVSVIRSPASVSVETMPRSVSSGVKSAPSLPRSSGGHRGNRDGRRRGW